MTAVEYPHITIPPEGDAYIGDTRYKVIHLATEHYCYGWSAEELLRQHSDLRPEEVYSALGYFYDNRVEFLEQIESSADLAKIGRDSSSQLSREELLARRLEKAG